MESRKKGKIERKWGKRARRVEVSYPYFRLDIEGGEYDLDKLNHCVPRIWFDEYHCIPRDVREGLISPDFKREINKYYYAKCQHGDKRDAICDMCGENRASDSIERTFLSDLSTHEDNVVTVDDYTMEMEQDGTVLEITWDEIGSEIFSRTFQPSLQLKLIMEGLKQLN